MESGGVTEEVFVSVARAAKEKGVDIPHMMVFSGKLRQDQVTALMANWYGVQAVDLKNKTIPKELLDLIPESFARSQHIVPIATKDGRLEVAAADPRNIVLQALLEKYVRVPIDFVYASPSDIEANLFRFKEDPKQAFKSIVDRAESEGTGSKTVELVDNFIEYAYQYNVSDIHVEPEDDYTIVRFRMDGMLYDMTRIPKDLHDSIITRLKVLAHLATDEHRAAQDGKVEYKSVGGDLVELRISIVPTSDGEKAVMRLLSDKSRRFNLKDLGFGPEDLESFRNAIHRPWGMILVTGPTGSGKTTTLYAALKVLNKRTVNISSIEDPVEYDMEGVNQIQVNTKTNLTFAQGLRALVRQDPDIIMVGEIRDPETIATALTAAETGHLVLSTLHTASAPEAVERIIDVFDGAKQKQILTQLGAVLRGVVAQHLVRGVDGKRVAIREILLNTQAVSNLIRQNDLPQIKSVIQTGTQFGMQTMEQATEMLQNEGLIAKEEA